MISKNSTLEVESTNNKDNWISNRKNSQTLNLSIRAFGENHGKSNRILVEPDRALAIKKAVEMAGPSDMILVAGKGHESYQILGDKKFPFKDNKKLMEAFDNQ